MFYSEDLCPSVFTGLLELRGVPFLPRSQFFPRTRSDQPHFYTLQRCAALPMRDLIIVTNRAAYSHPHFLGVRPSIRPKPITALLRDPAHPPFCSSDLGAYLPSTASYTTVVPPSVTLAGLLQSIIDAKTTHPVRWEVHVSQLTGSQQDTSQV